jgi:hypothetical protein
MGVFNLIETFFFLSLAITFVLILLLVNHFKQRINTIEQKCDTMFEIINNMMQQIDSMVHRINIMQKPQFMSYAPFSKTTPEIATVNVEELRSTDQISMVMKDKIVVSDDEDDEEEDDESEYDESECNDSEGDNDEDEWDDENVVTDESKIKIINVDIQDKINVENLEEDEGQEITTDLEEVHPEVDMVQMIEESEIQIEKVDNDVSYINDDNNHENSKDVYNKMNVQDLKKLVITKGLCSDASKLKKNELLKLLETTDL